MKYHRVACQGVSYVRIRFFSNHTTKRNGTPPPIPPPPSPLRWNCPRPSTTDHRLRSPVAPIIDTYMNISRSKTKRAVVGSWAELYPAGGAEDDGFYGWLVGWLAGNGIGIAPRGWKGRYRVVLFVSLNGDAGG